MADSPHQYLRPKLVALLAEAEADGYARDVAVAVITDLVNGALAADTPAPSEDNPNQDIGEPDTMAAPQSGVHPSLPDEPAGADIIDRPGGQFGHHRRW